MTPKTRRTVSDRSVLTQLRRTSLLHAVFVFSGHELLTDSLRSADFVATGHAAAVVKLLEWRAPAPQQQAHLDFAAHGAHGCPQLEGSTSGAKLLLIHEAEHL